MTEIQAKKLVAVIVAAYPNSKITLDTVGVYVRMLADLDYAAADAALDRLIAISKWPPTIAEIRESAATLYAGEVRPGGEAWGVVIKAIGRYGRNRIPGKDFDLGDEVALEVVQALNWRELCDSENPVADRARFVELYDRIAGRTRRTQLSETLPAMQQFRALQAEQEQRRLAGGDDEARPIGKVLQLVTDAAGGAR